MYPKIVTLRADRRGCSNSLLTAHFVFVSIFVVLFYARDCPRKSDWFIVGLYIYWRNTGRSRYLCSDHCYFSGGLLCGPSVVMVDMTCFFFMIYGYKYSIMEC